MRSRGMLLRVFWILNALLGLVASYAALSNSSLRQIPEPGADFDIEKGSLLAPILVPRVPGSEASLKVLQHFVDFFKKELPEWKVEIHNSTSKTPATGNRLIPFRNLILTRDPPWSSEGNVRRLALVAHYDSKREPEGFIGATDSAVPCAILMHTARSLDRALTRKWAGMRANDGHRLDENEGVQIILLDGEEAFVSWTADDSLYGARALAEDWENTMHPAMSTYKNKLSSISMFVLLDLLGEKNPTVPSYFKMTHWAYKGMAKLEQRLRSLDMFKSSPNHESKRWPSARRRQETFFLGDSHKQDSEFRGNMVEDDHIPFMARGVDILHIIPIPFPAVWHNERGIPDDGEHLDMDTVEDWAILITAFTAEWMELEGFLGGQAGSPVRRATTGKSEL